MSETGSKISNWIWINTPDAGIHKPNLYRPVLPFGERLFHPFLDSLERILGSKDLLFQIRDRLFANAKELIQKTRSIRYLNLQASVIVSQNYLNLHSLYLPSRRIDSQVDDSGEDMNGYTLDIELIGGWLRQQFATWALVYYRDISPLIKIDVRVENIQQHFEVDGPKNHPSEPKARFNFIAPYLDKNIILRPGDFEKTYCDLGQGLIRDKTDKDFSSILPLVSDHHLRIFWDIQPWLVHIGDHETWLLNSVGKNADSELDYSAWKMLPDNAFVPLNENNIILLGRVTRYKDGLQPVRGSLIIRYLGEK